ncbi:MAG: oligosaccharide flippase family protein [Bacteroidales bacterium]
MAWYFAGTAIPMMINLVKTPVFTRYFTPDEYGLLGIVSITFSYLSIVVFSWLASCLWRYYNSYKLQSRLPELYRSVFLLFLAASIVLILAGAGWSATVKNPVLRNLILLSVVQFMLREAVSLQLVTIRLDGRAKFYNLIHSSRTFVSFVLLLLLAFVFNWRIEAIPVSMAVIDLLVLIFLAFNSKSSGSIFKVRVEKQTYRDLIRFGTAGLLSNFLLMVIATSDRYFLVWFTDMETVGIYNQVYNLSQLSIAALAGVYINTVSPDLNRALEVDFEGAALKMRQYIHLYLLAAIPLVTFLTLFPKQIAFVLLGQDFRPGYIVMPWIFVAALLNGLFLFLELRLKFANRLRTLVWGIFFAALLNAALNYIFIPLYGYQWAAITTLVAYLFLVSFFYIREPFGFFGLDGFRRPLLINLGIAAINILVVTGLPVFDRFTWWQAALYSMLLLAGWFLMNRKEFKRVRIEYNIPEK